MEKRREEAGLMGETNGDKIDDRKRLRKKRTFRKRKWGSHSPKQGLLLGFKRERCLWVKERWSRCIAKSKHCRNGDGAVAHALALPPTGNYPSLGFSFFMCKAVR